MYSHRRELSTPPYNRHRQSSAAYIIKFIDRLIDINGVSIRLVFFFYPYMLGNHDHFTFMFPLLCSCFQGILCTRSYTGRKQLLSRRVRVNLGVMAIKEYSTLSRTIDYEPHHLIKANAISYIIYATSFPT